MPIESQPVSEQEHKAIIFICILGAFADGGQDEVERTQIERIVKGFAEEHLDLANAYQDVLSGKLGLATVVSQLQSQAARALAYEMAVCVCNADGVLRDPERQFLAELRQGLQLESQAADSHQHAVQTL